MIETSASAIITGATQALASGNSPMQNLIMAKVPILSRMPTISVDEPGVACSAANGSQVCSGTIGALITNAIRKPTIRKRAVSVAIGSPARSASR